MADNLYLPQVDYTSRDYTSISSDLKALIENFAPQWTSRDSSDFGIVILELFAYLGDILNYQIDRAANESFISTSTQRDTVLRIARLLNYVPNDINPATGSVTFSNYDTVARTILAGTSLLTVPDGTNSAIEFTTDSDITIAGGTLATASTGTVTVTQGVVVKDELIGSSDGTPNQEFALSSLGVITGSTIAVKVGTLSYTRVDFLIDYGSDDPVFSTYTDGAGITRIVFGDGVSGRIPTNGTSVYATYRYSDTAGALGNIAANTLTVVSPTTTNLEVTNPLSFSGGSDAETTDSVRVNAPLSLRALTRAVSLRDYISLAIQVNGVAKANAMATAYGAVSVFVAAAGGGALSSTLQNQIKAIYTDAVPPGTTVEIRDFTPVYPYVTVTVNVLPQYNAANVGAAVASALGTLFAFDNVTFNDLINQGSVYAACNAVDGVAYVTLNNFEKFPVNPNSASKVYSQSAITTQPTSTSATNIIVDSTVGLWTSTSLGIGSLAAPRIISPVAFNNATITGITSSVGSTVAITGITSTTAGGGTITYAATSPALVVGQLVTVTGATATQYNVVSQPVASVTSTNFTVTLSVTSGATSTATATAITGAVAISTAPTSIVASGTTVTIQNYGTVSDVSCNINEVPIYEPTYINVITSGGTS
jgi:3D (Asp-Asp-Asp) domain-containing protein